MMGKMMAAGVDLIIQSRPRQASWMAVKRWTLLRGTCLRSRRSGWCFAGINNSCTLLVNWGNKRRTRAGCLGSLESVTVAIKAQYWGSQKTPLAPSSPRAWQRNPSAQKKQEKRTGGGGGGGGAWGIGKYRQEVPVGKERRSGVSW